MTADLIVTDAKVLTMDPSRPTAEAVAIKDGKILAISSAAADQEGYVDVYTESNGEWNFMRKIVPSVPSDAIGFGMAIDFNDLGTMLLIGAPSGSSLSKIGATYVFV